MQARQRNMATNARRRFTLGSLALLIVVISLFLAYVSSVRQGVADQKAAYDAISNRGGDVRYGYESVRPYRMWAPEWLRAIVDDDDYFRSISCVKFVQVPNVTDRVIEQLTPYLARLPRLTLVDVIDTDVSRRGCEMLRNKLTGVEIWGGYTELDNDTKNFRWVQY
jgi:hypothetical protein